MNSEDMRQCELYRTDDPEEPDLVTTETVAWIPVEYAIAGKILDLRQEDGSWSSGWTVGGVFKTRLSADYVREHERDYKTQRQASDI